MCVVGLRVQLPLQLLLLRLQAADLPAELGHLKALNRPLIHQEKTMGEGSTAAVGKLFDCCKMTANSRLSVERVPVVVRHQAVAGRRQVDGFGHQGPRGDQGVGVVLRVELPGQRRRVHGEGGERGRVALPQREVSLRRECGAALDFARLQVARLAHLGQGADGRRRGVLVPGGGGGLSVRPRLPSTGLTATAE